MYNHHIDEMVDKLIKSHVIPDVLGARQAATKRLKEYWADKIAIVLCREDVINRAKKRNLKINHKQADRILRKILHSHDFDLNITRVTIDRCLNMFQDGSLDNDSNPSI